MRRLITKSDMTWWSCVLFWKIVFSWIMRNHFVTKYFVCFTPGVQDCEKVEYWIVYIKYTLISKICDISINHFCFLFILSSSKMMLHNKNAIIRFHLRFLFDCQRLWILIFHFNSHHPRSISKECSTISWMVYFDLDFFFNHCYLFLQK